MAPDLFSEVLDDAGLYPPAELTMESALARHAVARREVPWLVRHFVCPASRLIELAASGPRPETLVVTGGDGDWDDARAADAEAMNRFLADATDTEIVAYEVRVPATVPLDEVVRSLGGFRDVDVMLELPLDDALPDHLAAIAESEWIGAKARLGGGAVPSCDAVALLLRECLDLQLALKLTAGLHHPLIAGSADAPRHHGFVNVLGALALAAGVDLGRTEIARILADPEPSVWNFGDGGVAWRDLRADASAIDEARATLIAFGSCSIDEPLEGLRSMGVV